MEKTLSQLIAEMDKIEALSEQLTPRDKSKITSLYNQYKDKIPGNVKGLAARVYDAAINDTKLSSKDVRNAKSVYNQVMPQVPGVIKNAYGGMIKRGLDQLDKSAAAEPAQAQAQAQTQEPARAQGDAPAPSGGAVRGGSLRRGSKGEAVKDLQNKLGIAADGEYGPATADAVKKFQQENGLEADGVVGPSTLAALNSEPAQEPTGADPSPADQPSDPDSGTAGTPSSRLDTKGETPPTEPEDEPEDDPQPDDNSNYNPNFFSPTAAEDADEIERLMSASARSPQEESRLAALARKYGFYGKPEKLGDVLTKLRSNESIELNRMRQLAGM